MKKSFYLLALLLAGSGAKIAVAQAEDGLTAIPKIVGEGTVSSKNFEFNFTTTTDSSVAFFSKALLPDWRRISIVYTKRKKGAWQKPMLAPFSGHYRDADPFIAPDQSKLVFISDRPSKYQKSPSDYTIWMISQPFLANTEPVQLEGDFYELLSPLYPSLSLNGNLYFSANSDNDSDIYFVKNEYGKYKLPVKLTFNSPEHRDLDPIIAPDESFIIFTSTSRKGFGGTDLYVSFQNNGMWSEPVNLGKHINSFSNEGQPGISPDGKKLYFSTSRAKDKTDYAPRGKRIKTAELEKELDSPFNGLPNIWEISIEYIHRLNDHATATSN